MVPPEMTTTTPGPDLNIQQGAPSQDLAKSRSCEICAQNHPITPKFDGHLNNSIAKAPVKSESDTLI